LAGAYNEVRGLAGASAARRVAQLWRGLGGRDRPGAGGGGWHTVSMG
jgi:hypothetical protein